MQCQQQTKRRCRKKHDRYYQPGVALRYHGKSVLLIDLDAQTNITISLDYYAPDDLTDTIATHMSAIFNNEPVRLDETIQTHPECLGILPVNIQLAGMDTVRANIMSRETMPSVCSRLYKTTMITASSTVSPRWVSWRSAPLPPRTASLSQRKCVF